MHLPDTFRVTARPDYIVVELREICCGRELRSGDMTQGVEEEVVSQFGTLVYKPSTR